MKCQNENCKNIASGQHAGNKFHYCKRCHIRIDRTLEIMRDDKIINTRWYGNPDGSIESNEYWGRSPS